MSREILRQHFSDEAYRNEKREQFAKQIASFEALENRLIEGFNKLFKFLDGKTTKTEITNHLKEIGTPDVKNVVEALKKVDKSILDKDIDLKPLLVALGGLQAQIKAIPKAEFHQKDELKVTNLDEIVFDTSDLEKAIKALKLEVKVEPKVNVEKPELKPLQDVMLDLLKAFNKQKEVIIPDNFKITNLDEIKPTDTKNIEKKIDKSNELLKEIVEKPMGGGGGGSESTLAFPLYADITTTIATVGAVKTITETDGAITLTTTIDKTDPDNKSITEEWS